MGSVFSSNFSACVYSERLTRVQITRVHFPISYDGRERKIAYVEFTDEDAMNAGLDKRAEVVLLFSSWQSSDHAFY